MNTTKKWDALEYIKSHSYHQDTNEEVNCTPLYQSKLSMKEIMQLFANASSKKSPD